MLPRTPVGVPGRRRRGAGSRGRAAGPAAPVPGASRRRPAARRGRASSASGSSGASRRSRTRRPWPGARPMDAPPLDPGRLVRALDRLAVLAPPIEPPPEVVPRVITLTERADDHPRGAPRRPDGRAPGPAGRRPRPRRDRGHVPGHARADEAARDRRVAGGAVGPDRRPRDDRRPSAPPPAWTPRPRPRRSTSRWSRSRDRRDRRDRGRRAAGRRGHRRTTPHGDRGRAPVGRCRAPAHRAHRAGARGPPVRRRTAAVASRDRRAGRHGPRDRRRAARRPRGLASRARHPRCSLDADRVELATAPDGGALVARYVGADAVRLSPASLETLAIVAYRQPITKAAVERIRGVDSDYTMRSLLHRRLIVELGRSSAPGRPFLYGTGFDFLERFGLTSLEELPPLDVEVAAPARGGGRRGAGRRRPATRPSAGATRRRRPTPDVGELG